MTKYLPLAALLFLLISSVGWALYITEFAGADWRIVGFGISLVFGSGAGSMFIVWLLHLLRIVK